MIDRKDLKVGLVTEEGREISAIGVQWLLYVYDNAEHVMHIDSFCKKYSIKKEKVEIVRWVNIYKEDAEWLHSTKEGAEQRAGREAIAVAVKLEGSYEV